MKTFGDRLKYLRTGMSQAELADILCIKQTTLSNYERCRNEPNYETLKIICSHFGVTPEWFIYGTGSMRAGYTTPETQNSPEYPAIPTKTESQCPRCERMEAKLEKVELQGDELAQENRHLWKENGELRERCATLEERQKQCCPDQYHPKKANIPSSDPLHIR